MRLHKSHVQNLERQQARRPEEWEETFRQMVLFDLAEDMQLGFLLAYYRTFAVPSGSETLVRNGEIPARPMKRTVDTGIVIYELIANGLDSERGRSMTALLNRVHQHVPGSRDDFLYVLLTLLVVPVRWTRRHGWREPAQTEVEAATRFFRELGMRMHIAGYPETFEEAAAFLDTYEKNTVRQSPAGRQLMGSTVQVLQSMQPKILHPVTRVMISAMLDDVRLTEALGLPRSRWWTRAGLNIGLGVRNATRRRRAQGTVPFFSPGQEAAPVYAKGYDLAEIGPENVMGAPGRSQH